MDENNNNNKDSIYDYFTGYFPKKYDLSPEELDEEIVTETKKREIALGMITPKNKKESDAAVSDGITKAEPETPPAKQKPLPEPDGTVAFSDNAEETEPNDMPDAGDEESAPFTPVFDSAYDEPYEEDNGNAPDISFVPDEYEDNEYGELFTLFEEDNNIDDSGEISPDTDSGDDDPSELKMRRIVNWFFDFLEVFAICLAVIILVFSFAARLTKVDGISMNDTLSDSDYLIVSNLFYTPTPGDIVVVQNTSLEIERLREPLVKRVIAVAGQTVNIDPDGTVKITDADGTERILDEPYVKYEYGYTRTAIKDVYVPEGYVFVAGDNRDHSTDSRRPEVGLIDTRCVFGKAILRALPFSDFKVFENPFGN